MEGCQADIEGRWEADVAGWVGSTVPPCISCPGLPSPTQLAALVSN